MEWEDTSSYSRDDEERVPHAWTLKVTTPNGANIRLIVHRHIHYPPESWLLSCHEFGIEAFELGTGTGFYASEAQSIALHHVARVAHDRADALTRAILCD